MDLDSIRLIATILEYDANLLECVSGLNNGSAVPTHLRLAATVFSKLLEDDMNIKKIDIIKMVVNDEEDLNISIDQVTTSRILTELLEMPMTDIAHEIKELHRRLKCIKEVTEQEDKENNE